MTRRIAIIATVLVAIQCNNEHKANVSDASECDVVKSGSSKRKFVEKKKDAVDAGIDGESSLPETLSKSQIANAFRKYVPELRECVYKQTELDPLVTGTMLLSMEIFGTGRAGNFKVLSVEHQGTYVHKCVEEVFKVAVFPKFTGEPIPIKRIPLRLHGRRPEKVVRKATEYRGGRLPPQERINIKYGDPAKPGKVLPRLSDADVLLVMRKNISEFKKCIRGQKEEDASVQGRMEVTFLVRTSGSVKSVNIEDSMFRNSFVGNCVSKIIKQLLFPRFSGEPKKVTFPFTVK